MTSQPSEDGSLENRLEEIVAAALEAEADGKVVDLERLARGDTVLMAKAREVLRQNEGMAAALFAPESASPRGKTPGFSPRSSPEHDEPTHAEPGFVAPLQVGDFRIHRRLGAGGMGTVYRALQISLQRPVALKVVDFRALGDTTERLRFRREAELTASIAHPGIVPIYAIGEEPGFAWIAMKLLSGPRLDEAPLPLPPTQVAKYGHSIARAMEDVHLAGIVHRDLKPSNLLLDGEQPCIIDFGLARARTDATLTAAGAVPGTLSYLAPELLSGGTRAFDPASDVYSLGVTLYELATGRLPFPGDDALAVVRRALLLEPPPLGLARTARDLETIILRAMQKDRARRFSHMADLASELERFLAGHPIQSRRTSWVEKSLARARRHPKATAAVLAAFAIAVATGAFLTSSLARETQQVREMEQVAAQALDLGDGHRALSLLASVRDRVDLRLIETAEARARLEDLMDAVAHPLEATRAIEIERARARLLDSAAPRLFPRESEDALCLAAWHEDDNPSASAGLKHRFDATAVSHGDSWRLDSEASDDERCLAWIARRRAGDRSGSMEDLVASARHPNWPRLIRMRALAAAERGDHREASAWLEGIDDPSFPRREIVRNLAKLRARRGDLDAALKTLERIPHAEWSAAEVTTWFDIWSRKEAPAELLVRARRFLEDPTFSSEPAVLRVVAEVAGQAGDFTWAQSMIVRARNNHPSKRVLELIDWVELQLEERRRGPANLPEQARFQGDRGLELAVAARAQALIRSAQGTETRARARWVLARALIRLGKPCRAFTELRTAIRDVPDLVEARLELVVLVHETLHHRDRSDDWRHHFEIVDSRLKAEGAFLSFPLLASEARQVAKSTLLRSRESSQRLTPSAVELLSRASAGLAERALPDLELTLFATAGMTEGEGEDRERDHHLEAATRVARAFEVLAREEAWSGDDLKLVPDLSAER